MKAIFEHLGYSIEYYIDGKYIGSQFTDIKPIKFGYASRQYHIADSNIMITNALGKVKKIKAGTRYYTEYIELCGKLLNTHKEKVDLFRNSKEWRNA